MTTERTYNDAAEWLARQDGDAMDWDAFTAWLEVDPRHRAAYDELALLGASLDEHAAALAALVPADKPTAANDRRAPAWGRKWAVLGGGGAAVAAGVALLLVVQPIYHGTAEEYRSTPGHSELVTLAGGTKIVLAPASELRVAGDKMALQGTAYFDVPHQLGRTLTIAAGDFQVTDIGTRFAVGNEPDAISVDVADGALTVASRALAKPIALSAGHGMIVDRAAGTVRLIDVEPREVASWRSGKLQFNETPLSLVARELSRYSGRKVTVDPAIATQRFSGVIAFDNGEEPARTLAEIMSLDVRKVGGTSRLEPRRR